MKNILHPRNQEVCYLGLCQCLKGSGWSHSKQHFPHLSVSIHEFCFFTIPRQLGDEYCSFHEFTLICSCCWDPTKSRLLQNHQSVMPTTLRKHFSSSLWKTIGIWQDATLGIAGLGDYVGSWANPALLCPRIAILHLSGLLLCWVLNKIFG